MCQFRYSYSFLRGFDLMLIHIITKLKYFTLFKVVPFIVLKADKKEYSQYQN